MNVIFSGLSSFILLLMVIISIILASRVIGLIIGIVVLIILIGLIIFMGKTIWSVFGGIGFIIIVLALLYAYYVKDR